MGAGDGEADVLAKIAGSRLWSMNENRVFELRVHTADVIPFSAHSVIQVHNAPSPS